MKLKCEDCRSLEKDIYWTHFRSMHFCQILTGDFHSQLMIPKKFSDNMSSELNKKLVILRGPSGVTWDVALSFPNGEDVYLGEAGWQDFVKAHSLVENDILIFKYKGNSEFDVLVFEGVTLCEKEDSYFIRKCGHTSRDPSSHEMLQGSTNITAKTNLRDDRRNHNVAETRKNPNPCSTDKCGCALGFRTVEENQMVVANPVKVGSNVNKNEESQSGEKSKPVHYVWEKVKLPMGPEVKKRSKESTSYKLYYVSNRRPVTESEIEMTLDLASNQLTPEDFLVVMRATHVYKRFYISLPADWMAVHLSWQSQEVILRMGDRKWKTRLLMSKKGTQGGLSCGGWQDFAVDNNLEEFDVCLFKLASKRNEPVMFDVTVFRVVDEVVAPTRISASASPSTGYRRSRSLISRAARRKLRL